MAQWGTPEYAAEMHRQQQARDAQYRQQEAANKAFRDRVQADAARQKQQQQKHHDTMAGMTGAHAPPNGNWDVFRMGRTVVGNDGYTGKPLFTPHTNQTNTNVGSSGYSVGNINRSVNPKQVNPEDLIRQSVKKKVFELSGNDDFLFYYLNNDKRLKRTQNLFSKIFNAPHTADKVTHKMGAKDIERFFAKSIDDGTLFDQLIKVDEKTRLEFFAWHDHYRKFAKQANKVKRWDLVQFQVQRLNDNLRDYKTTGAFSAFLKDNDTLWEARVMFSALFAKDGPSSQKITKFGPLEIASALEKVAKDGRLKDQLFYADKETRDKFLEFASNLSKFSQKYMRKQKWEKRKEKLKRFFPFVTVKNLTKMTTGLVSNIYNILIVTGGMMGVAYLSLANDPEASNTNVPDNSQSPVTTTSETGLNDKFTHYVETQNDPLTLRKLPDINASVVGSLSKGECLTVSGTARQGWATIDLPNNETGYVANRFLTPVTPQTNCPN